MTEKLLEQLEEKIINLLAERERLQQTVAQLAHENQSLKSEKSHSQQKLQDIASLLDTVDVAP